MLDKIRERRENEEGFTLIELMVVVLIIAILLAIAIPTFLGARNRANDRAAQSSLRNGLTAAKVLFTDAQDYTFATETALQDEEPAIDFVAGASDNPKEVSIEQPPTSTSTWRAAAFSKSGTCFYIMDDSAAGGLGTTYEKVEGQTSCTWNTPALTDYTVDGWD